MNTVTTASDELITKTSLTETYGLNDTWIARLGEPHKTKPNPYSRKAPPMRLYRRIDVENFLELHNEEYNLYLTQRAKRSKISKSIAEKKQNEAQQWAESLNIKIYRLPRLDRLTEKATLFYEGTPNTNGIIAYVRHNYTNYEEILTELERGKVGSPAAYRVIKDRVNSEIEQRLNHYQDELVSD